MSCLKELVWKDATKVAGVYCEKTGDYIKGAISFCSTLVADYVIRQDDKIGDFTISYGGRNENTYKTIEEAQEWAEYTHYKDKMSPYLKQPKEVSMKDTEYTKEDVLHSLNMLTDVCHGASVKGGWWHDINTGEALERNKLEMLMLIVSEAAEACEGVRKGINDDHLPQYPMEDVEIADVLVRVFDYIGGHKLQTANAFVDKIEYNANRADHKVSNRKKDGGKKV